MVDTTYPYFSFFCCNTFFHFCKQFTAINGHNKQVSVALITRVQKCEWRLLLHNSWNVFLILYVQWLLLCQQRDQLIYEKIFLQTCTTAILHFLRRFFIVMNVDLEIFVKTHVLLFFYNETRSSQNFAIFTRKHLC